jgi:gliding motility-associated-like protein
MSPFKGSSQIIDTLLVGTTNAIYSVQPNPILFFTWEIEDGIILSGQGSSTIRVDWGNLSGLKKIIVYTNPFGSCYSDTSIAYVLLEEKEEVFFPNSFTPNGDGLNDVFRPIINSNSLLNYQITILNRWGEMVFYANNPEEYWTGKDKDGNIQTGVFVCLITITTRNNKEQYFKKMITLYN